MARTYCSHCQLPNLSCLCAHVVEQTCPVPVLIYQHPLEAKHAKSTVPLLRLALPDIQVDVGEVFTSPPLLSQGDWWLLYPDAQALDIDKPVDKQAAHLTQANIGGLIILDGTWRKTRLLLHLNPWLRQLPCLSFSQAPPGAYHIRKGPGGQALSTLESLSHVLDRLSPTFSPTPLRKLLSVRVKQFVAYTD
ncbi:tRNA-uridine aminocarboxypropyltransferase [Oceanisphaera pacifica]|uniref:tRNA-uridine aminocarboxypropyltransferase n=1 Tax=Oceanisphaera pacifica TaxID=2818389 RepID=A0ABS3NCR6_9GAMM|nr:tRNA-uridine aminocarboxypropyltransferase [Oceanisphaera pacifica]MBO1518330.1 DTW domain-containing protein [Oceanisphaera pacifica]